MARRRRPTETGQRRVAGYIRISALMGREQGVDLLSDAIQREKIEAWAAYRGLDVGEWYVDLDVSGRSGVRRPEFERMMADAAAGKFETIAVYRLTRFARSVANAASAVERLEQHGVSLVSVTEDIDTGTVAGTLLRNILFALAEFESERISEEWRNVHASRRRRGIAHISRPILGYTIEGAELRDVIEDEAAAVRLIYAERLRGASYGEIRAALHAAGHRPKCGGEWFPPTSIQLIVSNPVYAGLVRLPDGELIDGVHDAIVARETWEAVQAARRRITVENRFRSDAVLSGLLVCSGCGSRLTISSLSGGRRVYRCRARQSLSHGCPAPVSIEQAKTDEWVQQQFLARFDPRRMPNRGRVRRSRQQTEWARRATAARARVGELDRALDELADQRFVKGTIDGDEYARQARRYTVEREERAAEAADMERMAQTVTPLEQDVLAGWWRLPAATRKRALRQLIDRIVVQPSVVRGGSHSRGIDFEQRLDIVWTG